jgi:hypothetical protein
MCIATLVFLATAESVVAQSAEQCRELGLAEFNERRALVLRLARADTAVLPSLIEGQRCFQPPEFDALARAAGEYFDVRPRDYLLALANASRRRGSQVDVAAWLRALSSEPRRYVDDFVRLEALQRRIGFFGAHVSVLATKFHADGWQAVTAPIEARRDAVIAKLPPVLRMADPLLALEFPLAGAQLEPAPAELLSVDDRLRGHRWSVFARAHGTSEHDRYWLISGMSFVFDDERDPPRPLDIASDLGWVVRERTGEPRKVIGVTDNLYDLEPEVVAALCEDAVRRLQDALGGRESLQQGLDERISRNPAATLESPLRRAFEQAGYDVRRFN